MNCVEFCTVQETISSISAFLCDADAQFVIQLISLNMCGLFLGCHLAHMVVYKYMGKIFLIKKENKSDYLLVCLLVPFPFGLVVYLCVFHTPSLSITFSLSPFRCL